MLLESAPYPSQSSSCTAAVYVNQAQEMFHHFRGGRQKIKREKERERKKKLWPQRNVSKTEMLFFFQWIQLNLQFQGHRGTRN